MSEVNMERDYVKILVWLIPVIFGAGGVYAHVNRASADADSVKKTVIEHTQKGVGHTATQVRLDQMEKNQARILSEQKSNGENIAAICQATGAKCR